MAGKKIRGLDPGITPPPQTFLMPIQDPVGSSEPLKYTIAQLKASLALVKSDVGLGNVDNVADINKPVSTATQTALNLKANNTITVNGYALTANVVLAKTDIGLGNVDNTTDLAKPVSNATQTALNDKKPIIKATRTSHGWTVGMVLYRDAAGVWQRANSATNSIAARSEGVVTSVIDANTVVVGTTGDRFNTTGLGLTAGIPYFLKPDTGTGINYTATEPSAVGQVTQVVFQTNSTNEATIILSQPFEIISPSGGIPDGDKGDISVTGGVWTIDTNAVSYAKIQAVTDNKLLGRSAGTTGVVQEISIGSGLSMSAGTLSATGGGGGGASDYVLLATVNPIGVANYVIDISSYTTYVNLEFEGYNISTSNNCIMYAYLSTNGGSSYVTTGFDTKTTFEGYSGFSGNVAASILQDVSSGTNYLASFRLILDTPFLTTAYPKMSWNSNGATWRGGPLVQRGVSFITTAQDTDHIKFQVDAGTFTGFIKVWGRK